MGAVAYLALNQKSTFHVRLASLGALAVMIITVIICLVLIFTTPNEAPVDYSTLIVGAPPVIEEKDNHILPLLLTIMFFIALFAVITMLALKEHKKSAK